MSKIIVIKCIIFVCIIRLDISQRTPQSSIHPRSIPVKFVFYNVLEMSLSKIFAMEQLAPSTNSTLCYVYGEHNI